MSSWKMIYIIAAMTLQAQTPVPAPSVPLYRVTVEQNSATAINYRYLKGSTKIDFKPTPLAPTAKGMAKVASAATTTEIYAKFQGLPNPTQFGPEYLTYVLWAVSPEGRASNLGEILLKKGDGKVKVTEPLQSFGLVVTAEPYFAVSQPSNVVVLENAIRPGSSGKEETIDAKYDLLKRGTYHMEANAQPTMVLDKATPFEVYEARNAVAIARTEGAPTYAPEAFNKAQGQLDAAEGTQGSKKDVARTARQATQSAEDARLIAVKRQEAESLEQERKMAQNTIDQANTDAAAAKAATDQANAQAAMASSAAAAEVASADQAAKATQSENANLRAKMLAQLNGILETRATARGLIVNMSGMNFSTSKADLRPVGREKLAKIAGLVLAHPGLKMEVEGYTDSTGSDELNQRLSEKRAANARDYLVQEGVASDAIVARGLGKADPIESNSTASGRQKNRRVELVVSGAGLTDNADGAK
jgi:outer membrane protein OmpA-like peptidoglycan-associated protein